jgi:hypothetical protein
MSIEIPIGVNNSDGTSIGTLATFHASLLQTELLFGALGGHYFSIGYKASQPSATACLSNKQPVKTEGSKSRNKSNMFVRPSA